VNAIRTAVLVGEWPPDQITAALAEELGIPIEQVTATNRVFHATITVPQEYRERAVEILDQMGLSPAPREGLQMH